MKAAARSAGVPLRTILASLALLAGVHAASARTLQAIRERGTISLCAHPNSLPFASRSEQPAGFQIELGRALADRLGVSLTVEWVLISYQIPLTHS